MYAPSYVKYESGGHISLDKLMGTHESCLSERLRFDLDSNEVNTIYESKKCC